MRKVYKIWFGKSEGKRPLGRHKHRWEDNIRMNLRNIGWKGVDSFGSIYEPVAGSCERSNESSGSIKDGEFLKKDSDPWS
jgi:hypothetical protein